MYASGKGWNPNRPLPTDCRLRQKPRRSCGQVKSSPRPEPASLFFRGYPNPDVERVLLRPPKNAPRRRHLGVAAADAHLDVVMVRHQPMGGVEADPAGVRNEALHPGVHGAFLSSLDVQIAADVARGNAGRARDGEHQVREILADAAAMRQYL